MNDDIIWAWDLDEQQFVPLINAEDCFEPPKRVPFFNFTNIQNLKEGQTHKDLLDELRKIFGEE